MTARPTFPWFGLLFIGAGLLPLGAALFAESGFGAPRWVVAAAGGVFVLAGVVLLRQGGALGGRGGDLLAALAPALMTTAFAAISAWWLLFTEGPAASHSTTSIPFYGVVARRLDPILCFEAPGS